MVEPVAAWTLVRTISEATKKLYEIAKEQKDREVKAKLDEVLDELRDLKQQASELEDENRELREELRFKGDNFEFRNPFWYDKNKPDTPLCPKCFADETLAPMGEEYRGASGDIWRRCLVCANSYESVGRRHA